VTGSLALLDPSAVLERGYSIVTAEDGRIVRAAQQLRAGERVGIAFSSGAATARVEDVTKDKA
jgi:exodeoxyribonuclease VII large subunit